MACECSWPKDQTLTTGVPTVAQGVKNPTSIPEVVGLIPGLPQWVKGSDATMSCDVGCRCGSDLVWLRLWYGLAAADPVQLLVWELPYAVGVALKRKNKQNPCRSSNPSLTQGQCWRTPTCNFLNHICRMTIFIWCTEKGLEAYTPNY